MKRIIILGGALCLLAGSAANAEISVNLGFGEPGPAYVEAPEYVEPTPIYPSYAVEGGRYHEHYDHRRAFRARGPRGPVGHRR